MTKVAANAIFTSTSNFERIKSLSVKNSLIIVISAKLCAKHHYASTTSVLLKKSCSGLFKKGIKKQSITVSLVILRTRICHRAGLPPFLFTTLLIDNHFAGERLKIASNKM